MFPQRYKSVCKLRLPQVAEIEGKALQEYEDNPKLAIDKPQLLKQVKQGAGVIGDDESPRPDLKTVTVRVQQFFSEVHNQIMEGLCAIGYIQVHVLLMVLTSTLPSPQ